MNVNILIQAVGWVGTFLIVLAYYLVSSKKVDSASRNYQLMNLLGAICVGVNVYNQKAWPALALQVIWGVIAVVSIARRKG